MILAGISGDSGYRHLTYLLASTPCLTSCICGSPDMAFKLEPARTEDLSQIVSVIFRSHRGENPYINGLYPRNLTQSGQNSALQKLSDFTDKCEQPRWEKVTDTASGEIVGAAIWLVYERKKQSYAADDGASWGSKEQDEEEEYAQALNVAVEQVERPLWENEDLPLISSYISTFLYLEGYLIDVIRSFRASSSPRASIPRSRNNVNELHVEVRRQHWREGNSPKERFTQLRS